MSRYRRSLVSGGTFFFTVTLADRRSALLVTEIDRLRRAYAATAKRLPFETVAIGVLPDHLHAVWTLPPDDADYPRRWSLIKAAFSRGLPAAEFRSDSKRAKRDKGIWQRRYWEHQIRDEADLQRHCDYIHFNPVKHGLVARVQDWPHSSFHRLVREGRLPMDWGGDAQMDGNFGE
jgi:putative transposase